MVRNVIAARAATREDAPWLADLWTDLLRRADRSEQVVDLELVIKQAAATPEERLVVAEYDGQPAGAVLLRLSTLSPLNLEPCVQAIQPRVQHALRRRGVGKALMDAAVAFAEDNGVLLVAAVVQPDRDLNRFMARLGLGPMATWRMGSTALIRSRLSPAPRSSRGSGRNRVLAARRSARSGRSATEAVGDLDRAPVSPTQD